MTILAEENEHSKELFRFMAELDNWLNNKIGEHNPFMKQWTYTFEENNNQLKFNLLVDIEIKGK